MMFTRTRRALPLRPSLRSKARLMLQLLEERDVPATTWMFDFGTGTSPLAPGYTQVPLVSYTAAQGFGWQSTGGVSALSRTNPAPLTRDLHQAADATFL